MQLLATIIHSANGGSRIRMIGSTNKLKELNSSPRPAILTEWFWSRLRLMMQRDMMLRKAKGTSTGMPAQKMQVMMTMRQRLAASLATYSLKSVILLFIVFCRIRFYWSFNESLLLQQHLKNMYEPHKPIMLKRMQFVKIGETLRYQIAVKFAQNERLYTFKKLLMSEKMTVRKDTQLAGVKPKMLAQMRMGIRTELRVQNSVSIAVLYLRVAEKDSGLTKLMSFSEISVKSTLVTDEVMMTTY